MKNIKNLEKKNNASVDPDIFTVWNDEVVGNRIDAYFYQPKFKEFYSVLIKGNYKVGKLSDTFEGDLVKGILPNAEQKEGDAKIVQISCVGRDGVIDVSDCITAKKEIYDDKHKLQKNDILVVITGATIGKIGLWRENYSDFYLGGDIVKFQVSKNFNPIFMWAYLRSDFGQIQIQRHITGATNKHLGSEDVGNIQIPLLPLEKQNKVANAVQKAYEEKRNKEEEIKQILESIDGYVLGELGIVLERERAENLR